MGSCEAKTGLPELLRGVQAGKRYIITLRGEPVAALIPAAEGRRQDAVEAVEQMRRFIAETPNKDVDIRAPRKGARELRARSPYGATTCSAPRRQPD